MTDSKAAGGSPSEPTVPLAVAEWNSFADGLLTKLVEAVNKFESAYIGITLHVSGIVISGFLISAGSFFDRLGEQFRDAGNPEFAEGFAEFMAAQVREPKLYDIQEPFGDPRFIHLRGARIFTSGSQKPLPGTLWRGRLSEVSGWSMGQYGIETV